MQTIAAINGGQPKMRILLPLLYIGIVWCLLEYRSEKEAILAVAVLAAFAAYQSDERFSNISKVLERHAKRLFPELYD